MLPFACLLEKNWNLKEFEDSLKHDSSSVNEADSDGKTPLFHAVTDNRCPVDVIELLIKYGANVNYKVDNDRTPLSAALEATRDEAVISLLLKNGADTLTLYMPECPDLTEGKDSALCLALHNDASKGVVQLLLDAGCPLNGCENEFHGPVLFCAVDDDDYDEGKRGPRLKEDVLRLLVERGADVNAIDQNGLSVMCYAFVCGRQLFEVQMLLAVGVSLNFCTLHTSPFFCATVGNSILLTTNLVAFLLHKGAPLDQVDSYGLTPLQCALKFCKYETGAISLLLRYLPDVDVVDSSNNNLLALAAANGVCYNPQVVKLLIEHGVQVDNADVEGNTALHQAAYSRQYSAALRLLLKNGATVNAKNSQGKTPLEKAVTHCWFNIKTIRVLLAAGAHVSRPVLEQVVSVYKRNFAYIEELETNIRRSGLSYFQILLKYALLHNPNLDLEDLMEGHEAYETLSQFWGECVEEQQKMECVSVGEGCTLSEFLKEYSTPRNEAAKPQEKNYDFMLLLKIRANNVFPLFSDVISDKVDRWVMNAKLPEVRVYTMKYTPLQAGEREIIFLDDKSLYDIVQYLHDDDLCRLIYMDGHA